MPHVELWDGNPIKLDCDDPCTTINVINSLSNKKIKKKKKIPHVESKGLRGHERIPIGQRKDNQKKYMLQESPHRSVS